MKYVQLNCLFKWTCLISLLASTSFFNLSAQSTMRSKANASVNQLIDSLNHDFPVLGKVKKEKISVSESKKQVNVYCNSVLSFIPMREANVRELYSSLKGFLGEDFKEYEVKIFSNSKLIETLIPNFYRKPSDRDTSRIPLKLSDRPRNLIYNTSKPYEVKAGLNNKNIALWHSHGWYYEPSLDRWEWQRARVFQTVEDLLPMSFVLPYLAPMLENAGANVFIPRERDWQTNEIVVDNDSPNNSENQYYEISLANKSQWKDGKEKGFAVGDGVYEEEESPFNLGTYKQIKTSENETASIKWLPTFTEAGEYAVYVSYKSLPQSTEKAYYTVHHSGGETTFRLNQKISGSTWVYVGRFHFNKGQNEKEGSVVLSNFSTEKGTVVTADAVRFGGGMGNVARNGKTSGYPRFLEASRYYFQYSGIHDTLVYHLNENNDYKDDYQSRGEWVNYLKGAPFGPEKNRDAKGLGIPIDLSLAFHTDAGFTRNDTVVGTLMIHSTAADDGLFPDGKSRLANRDFSDILQTQLVEEIRLKYDSAWRRRGLWDKEYSEAYRPTVPSALLELLSHHNFLDMKFALDPRFRFDVSRTIYKSILKYLSHNSSTAYVVQPLPVHYFKTELTDSTTIKLSWKPTVDELEDTAKPTGFVVYKAIGNQGFDNGTYTTENDFTVSEIETGTIYRYKVTAINAGGESFPSEILSVGIHSAQSPTVMIVNGFDRISGPASINSEQFMGFTNFIDEGVPDRLDLGFVGEQYDFDPDSPWLDDDAPGHGASHSTYETNVIAGNTFNYPFIHGTSLLNNKVNFISCSDESVESGEVKLKEYAFVDWILGEEKSTVSPKYETDTSFRTFPKRTQRVLTNFLQKGGKLFISGAYIGTDLAEGKPENHPDVQFGQEVLKIKWRTNLATKKGEVTTVQDDFQSLSQFAFNTKFSEAMYKVEAPDAIEPATTKARTIMRYENTKSAGVAYNEDYAVISLGFPFETILEESARNLLMKDIIYYLMSEK